MPELPEVETVRRTLLPIVGSKVRSLWTSGKPLHMNRPVDCRGVERATVGGTFEAVRRIGKFLLLDFAGRPQSLVVHLGMTGRLRVVEARAPRPTHTHLIWSLSGRRELRYTDARRFGQVLICERDNERAHPALENLGIDPLVEDFSGELLYEAARGRKTAVKSLLLDQSVLAGIGNIYASEALWRAKISPTVRASRLTRLRALALGRAVVEVLDHALTHGGTSLRDFVDADGSQGEHSAYLWVYGRAGQSCRRRGCNTAIRRKLIQGRATFYCPRCQHS